VTLQLKEGLHNRRKIMVSPRRTFLESLVN